MNPHRHQARKRFGQNFLHDQSIINAIVDCINPHVDDNIVEIGPGLGALTRPLLARVNTLHAIELDRDLIDHLNSDPTLNTVPGNQQTRKDPGALVLHNADALKFDFSEFTQSLASSQKLRLVGNLPYNISTPLLFHLLKSRACIEDMTFMLQKELVDRIVSNSGTKTYGRLSVMLQYYCNVEALLEVPPHAFTPPPKVQSSVLKLTPKSSEQTQHIDFEALESVVRLAFASRRKTLRNNFRNELEEQHLDAAGINPRARAETLDLTQFINLATLWTRRQKKPF